MDSVSQMLRPNILNSSRWPRRASILLANGFGRGFQAGASQRLARRYYLVKLLTGDKGVNNLVGLGGGMAPL
jgi:hypothetical protein